MLLRLAGHEKDLGGSFRVHRLLPALARRTVGPFVFFDHFGPVNFQPGMSTDVRPHPHIGLATVTYLFEGAIMHRDSLGSVQRIEPGAINWMNSGRGIVHSERTPPDLRDLPHRIHGLQLWVGLPQSMEESAPSFTHTAADRLAPFTQLGAEVRLLVGQAFNRRSPVKAASPTLFLMLHLKSKTPLDLPALAREMAVYPIDGEVCVDGTTLGLHTLGVLEENHGCHLEAASDITVAVIGGEPLDGLRFLAWNFVSSTKSRLQRAADDWRNQQFDKVPGETEFIPFPENVPL